MRSTSVDELHFHTLDLVREAEEGGVIVIEREGSPVAELRPFSVPVGITPAVKERIFAEMAEIWARLPRTESTPLIEEDRQGR